MPYSLFKTYLEPIRNYVPSPNKLPDEFLLSTGPEGLSTYYAPFEHVNTAARIVICGITPGAQQADLALSAAAQALRGGADIETAAQLAKETASFGGRMRLHLVDMLDHIGIQHVLGISSCEALFSSRKDLVHYTSALRYPVFKNGENYSKSSLVRKPYLWDQVKDRLVEEITLLPDALWLAQGTTIEPVFKRLIMEGYIKQEKVIVGLPHASESNMERIYYFTGRKPRSELSKRTNPDTLDARKASILAKIASLRAGAA